MTLRLPLSGNKHAIIVSAYAPTMINLYEVKDKFYDDLDNIISATPVQTSLSFLVTLMLDLVQTIKPGNERYVYKVFCRHMQQKWSPASKEMC